MASKMHILNARVKGGKEVPVRLNIEHISLLMRHDGRFTEMRLMGDLCSLETDQDEHDKLVKAYDEYHEQRPDLSLV